MIYRLKTRSTMILRAEISGLREVGGTEEDGYRPAPPRPLDRDTPPKLREKLRYKTLNENGGL
jgi:hypothetical protein